MFIKKKYIALTIHVYDMFYLSQCAEEVASQIKINSQKFDNIFFPGTEVLNIYLEHFLNF